jgi:hypothetical protein
MTKNQIIAKAMLTTLGIYAFYTFSTALLSNLFQIKSAWGAPLIGFLFLITIFFVGRILIFKNNKLACKITTKDDDDEDFDRRNYLIKSFRISFVMLGLLLLCSNKTFFVIQMFFRSFSLPKIRAWIAYTIQTGDFKLSGMSLTNISGFFKLILIAYLLVGGWYIIKWHLKNSHLNPINEELTNE